MLFRWRHWGSVCLAALILSLSGGSALATPLGLILLPEADIFYDFASVTYVAATDTLTISGFAANVDALSEVNEPIVGGLFALSATIDDAGILSTGSFTVSGTVALFGWNSGTILTGNLTPGAVGFPDGVAGGLEFLWDTPDGDAFVLSGQFGLGGGITVGIVNGFPGDWTNDFSASFSAVGDIGELVPEPSTGLMLVFGLGLLSCRSRSARGLGRPRRATGLP